MWYVIQTVTGREEELITFIRTIIDRELFEECFVIKAEWMKRLGGQWQIQVRPLFPGYIFIETEQPEAVFLKLKSVPRFSKVLGNGKFEFTPVNEEERKFLSLISREKKNSVGQEHEKEQAQRIVRLTEVATDEAGAIVSMNGALEYFKDRIVRMNLHKRFAVIELTLFHKKRTLIFGIRLKHDR